MAKAAKASTKYRTLTAQLWEAFGAGAGMPMDAGCVAAARKRGYYKNVRERRKKFADPKVLDAAIRCSERAGKRAADLARNAGNDCITAAEFDSSVKDIEKALTKIGALGEICS